MRRLLSRNDCSCVCRLCVSMLLLLLAVSPGYTQPPTSAPARTGIQVYAAACAHCHGTDGRGVPADRLALPVPPRDFTDCQSGPREADSDWSAVIHEGGPVRVFNRTMPAFGDALSSAEIQLALNHVRSFCASTSWPRGELNFPKALVTEKAFPEDEVIVISSIATEGDGSVSNKVVYEKRLGAQSQIELVVPIAAHAGTTGNWVGGVGDAAFAFKRVLAHSRDHGSIVSLTGELAFPTGSTADSLGEGHAVFESSLTFGRALPADSFVQFQGGCAFPADDKASNEAFYRLAVGKTITQGRWGRSWTPMVEFLASQTLADGQKTSWDILPQMQVSLSTRKHILMNTGLRVPMTDYGPRKTQFVVYLLWDWYDGGFLQGW